MHQAWPPVMALWASHLTFTFGVLPEDSKLFVLVAVTPTLQVPIPQEQMPPGLMVITETEG